MPRNSGRLLLIGILLAGCEREQRNFHAPPTSTEPRLTQSSLAGSPEPYLPGPASYERIAYELSQGKQLYTWLNCKGCHADGGGGMGPALMDDVWRYGAPIENIAASIREGRPGGMPSFRDRATERQIWQLAGYIRSLAGLARFDAAPGRSDHLASRPPEARLPATSPVSGGGTPR